MLRHSVPILLPLLQVQRYPSGRSPVSCLLACTCELAGFHVQVLGTIRAILGRASVRRELSHEQSSSAIKLVGWLAPFWKLSLDLKVRGGRHGASVFLQGKGNNSLILARLFSTGAVFESPNIDWILLSTLCSAITSSSNSKIFLQGTYRLRRVSIQSQTCCAV